MKDVTLVITSCGRPDLLSTTIESFTKMNTYPLIRKVIIEDSANQALMETLEASYPDFEIILNDPKLGQIRSIDKAYSTVNTEYVFHCEDDWIFLRSGFIEDSMTLMESDPKMIQLQLRAFNKINGHPINPETIEKRGGLEVRTAKLQFDYLGAWHGFSFNPGLKRMSDYKFLGKYADIGHEYKIGKFYKDLGFYTLVCEGIEYVDHIGWNRHIEDLESKDLY